MRKEIVIAAPHPDDELIGCFTLLDSRKVDKVIYFFDHKGMRGSEAYKCAEKYGFTPVFIYEDRGTPAQVAMALAQVIYPASTLLIPAPTDYHPLHQYVYSILRGAPVEDIRYYSVEMNRTDMKVLTEDAAGIKKCALDSIYPSQRALWNNNAKYYLFEGITKYDYKTFATIKTSAEGCHQYPEARGRFYYLKDLHRHVFHVTVRIEQSNGIDRDIEYLEEKRNLTTKLEGLLHTMAPSSSCEDIALLIRRWYIQRFPRREIKVEVLEDGENGALIV